MEDSMVIMGFFGGLIVGGVAAVALKDKIMGSSANAKQQELNSVYAESEKFRKRKKELERQVEDLLAELNKIRRRVRDTDEYHDDLEDELDQAKRELKNIRIQNDELARKVKEYKVTCEAQVAEISILKNKLG